MFVRDLNDRLSGRAAVAGERGGRFGKRSHGTDDGLEPSGPQAPGKIGQPGAVGFDDEEDGAPVLGLHGGWHGDGDEGAAGAYEFGRSLEDVAADDVEHHIHLADVPQIVGVQVEERLRAEAERDITVVGSAGADDAGAHLSRELDGDRADAARGAVNEDGLAGREVGVVEQALPGGQSGNGQRGGYGVVDVGREGARSRASTAVNSARDPLRAQSVSPNTRWPTVRPVVP